jgi:hypothetical protein
MYDPIRALNTDYIGPFLLSKVKNAPWACWGKNEKKSHFFKQIPSHNQNASCISYQNIGIIWWEDIDVISKISSRNSAKCHNNIWSFLPPFQKVCQILGQIWPKSGQILLNVPNLIIVLCGFFKWYFAHNICTIGPCIWTTHRVETATFKSNRGKKLKFINNSCEICLHQKFFGHTPIESHWSSYELLWHISQ